MQMSFQTTANAWIVGRFWTYTEVEHAQGPNITNMYLANIGSSGSWVRGKRWHGLAVERGENLFWGSCSGSFGVPTQALLGEMSC